MKSEGWRDVRKGFKPQLQGTEGFCAFVAEVGRRGLVTLLELFAALLVHVCMRVHAAEGDTA